MERAVFPDRSNDKLTCHGKILCWRLNCRRCRLAAEAVGIHSECFDLFSQECKSEDALDRLWTVAVSRSLWPGAPNLRLDLDTHLSVELVYERAEQLGIPRLRLLPLELIQMIGEYSDSESFWRYIGALSFGRRLAAAPLNATSIPLCNISAWKRGTEPALFQTPDHPPLVRLTIDYRGIRQVERLPSRPPYQQGHSDKLAYVIEEERRIAGVTAQLKVISSSETKIPKSNAV